MNLREERLMASREEEYIRRMRARGYVPTLAGMDDEDIEWELERMDRGSEERSTTPLNPTYRPVDPGLKARILRMFGQPYDESAIPRGQEFYLNGWDNGDENDALVERNRRMEPAPLRNGAMGQEEYDPWKRAWKLDWGEEGRPAERPKTMEWRWGQDGAGVSNRGGVKNALGYGPGDFDGATGMKELSYYTTGSGGEGGVMRAGPLDKVVRPGGELIKNGVEVERFAKEVEEEALKNGDSLELAKKKGSDAASKYAGYLAGVGGAAALAGKIPRYGGAAGPAVETAGAVAEAYAVKPLIKKQVLGKSEDDYNKKEPLFPGNTPPGPG